MASSSSLGANLTSFVFLFPVGIRRLLCSTSLYLKDPLHYRSRTWYFPSPSEPKWKNLDFYFLLISLPISSFSLIFFFLLAFSGTRFAFLHGSAVVFVFWLLLILVSVKENVDPVSLPDHFVFVFAGITFLIEYMLNGSAAGGGGDITLGDAFYGLKGGLILSCAACCFYLSIKPSAFFAEFLLSSGLVLKGTWVLQAGLTLYTDTFSFKGCDKALVFPTQGKTAKCDLDEDKFRGIALMNLFFILHVVVVLVISFVLLGLLSRNTKLRAGGATGSLLAQLESDSMLLRPIPEFEIE